MSKLKSAYNLYDAKNSLSELVERVQAGEEIVIMKRGEPIAKMIPIGARKIRFGFLKGKIRLKPGWDEPITDFDETYAEWDELYGPEGNDETTLSSSAESGAGKSESLARSRSKKTKKISNSQEPAKRKVRKARR